MFKSKNRFLSLVVLFASCSVVAEHLYAAQPSAISSSRAVISSVNESSPGRYQIIGSVVGADNKPVCGLALASGKCVFSCGPGSLRCEGGTDSLALGQFDLKDLPTESNGTINLQTFVSGLIPGLQVVDPKCGTNCNNTPVGGLWLGSIIKFFVSPDGAQLTSSGSSIIYDGKAWEIELGPATFEGCGTITLRVRKATGGTPILANQFSYNVSLGSYGNMSIDGEFLTSRSSQGLSTWICGYAITVKRWTATPQSSASAAPLDTPSTNNPPIVEKVYDPETGAYIGEMVIYK